MLALVVDNGGMFMAGFAVMTRLLTAGPRCPASRSVWTRRTGVQGRPRQTMQKTVEILQFRGGPQPSSSTRC